MEAMDSSNVYSYLCSISHNISTAVDSSFDK